MRNTIDSFIKFLSNELINVPLHILRSDPNKPENSQLQLNAVNLYFLQSSYDRHISGLEASIDVVYEDELVGIGVKDQLWQILRKTFYIPKYNYLISSNPVLLNSNIYWDSDAVRFRLITRDNYTHFSCTLFLRHYIS